MAEVRGAGLFLLITLCGLYWACVLFFALGQFWVICNPQISVPHCPTLVEAGLRALGVLLGGSVVFGLTALIGQRLLR